MKKTDEFISEDLYLDGVFQKLALELSRIETSDKDDLVLIRKHDLHRIFWNNLERISYYLDEKIRKVVTTEKYDWSKEYSDAEIEALFHEERKKLYYLAAR